MAKRWVEISHTEFVAAKPRHITASYTYNRATCIEYREGVAMVVPSASPEDDVLYYRRSAD